MRKLPWKGGKGGELTIVERRWGVEKEGNGNKSKPSWKGGEGGKLPTLDEEWGAR